MIPIDIDNITNTTFNMLYTYSSSYRGKTGKEIGIFTYYYNLDCSLTL
jgi:hypothetical protein